VVPETTTGESGPLAGLRFVEMAGIGPAPWAAMVLADLGARGIRVESPVPGLSLGDPVRDITRRGRASVVVDLRRPEGVDTVLRLVDHADLLVEGFRPGVMERRGLGPAACLERNPRLVYGRMTGWGQEGPWARTAGHDIDYIAVAGVLAHVARRGQPPTPPLNLVGDYGGGGMLLLVGVLAALWEAQRSGRGQVVDAAMVDGAALLMAMFHSMRAQGMWDLEAGVNLLDSGAPFYDVYETADGGWLAVGCLEPAFFAEFLRLAGLDDVDPAAQFDLGAWPDLRQRISAVVAGRTRAEWAAVFDGSDACVAPVLSLDEAPEHPQLAQRGTFVTVDGLRQPAPAPRFDRTPAGLPRAPSPVGADRDALGEWGFDAAEVERLRAAGVLG
jgi:alpha-methylacyl-CoA racemase